MQVASKAQTGTLTTSSNPLQIGGDAFYGQYFAGRIDEVRVYASALSASQVQSDMNAPIGGSPGDTQPPTAPTNLQASAVSSTQVNLSWTGVRPTTWPSRATGWSAARVPAARPSPRSPSRRGTTFNDTGRSPSTSYSYRVRAVDAVPNFGGYSTTASATTPAASDTQPPTAPSNLQASAVSSTQVNLSWTASTDNVAVTGYRVERCQGAGCSNFAEIAQPSGTTFNDTGRSPSTSYSYRVRAVDAVPNFSGYSNTASATTPAASDTQPPTAPTNLQASAVSSTQVNLSWTASTDNVAVTGYRVERCQGAGCSTFAEIAQPSGTTFNDTGRSPSTSYSYRVRAVDAVPNFSGYSNTASATTPAGAPGLVAAYSFSEGTGTTVADASGTGNGGSIGTATWTTSGKYGNALSFNGTNARVTIPDAPSVRLTNANDARGLGVPDRGVERLARRRLQGRRQLLLDVDVDALGSTGRRRHLLGDVRRHLRHLEPPAQYVDTPRDDLRRSDTQAVRQRRAGREQGADRHADNVLEPAPDRW